MGHFLQALGYSSMLLLPLYLEHLGADREEIGTLMALAAGGGLVSRPFAAWALDAWGRRPTLLLGTALLATSMALFHFVRDLGWLVYADRVLLGVGSGTLFTGYFTWATDLVPPERRTEGIALFGISGLVPIGLNAFVGGRGFDPADLRALFVAVSLLIACSIPAVLALPETLDRAARAPGHGGWRGALGSLLVRRLWPVWLATVVFAGFVGLFFAFATVTAQHRGVARPSLLWLAYAGGAVGVRLIGSRLPDRVGPRNLVTPALGLYLGAMLLCARAASSEGFLAAGLLAGLAHGWCFPVLVSQVVARTPAVWRGSALAGFTATWQLAELLAPPAFGRFGDARGRDADLYLLAVVAGLGGLALWAALEATLGREERSAGHASGAEVPGAGRASAAPDAAEAGAVEAVEG
ncbi:MAG: MFS transporter [Planctomycetota bacterium]